MPSAKRSQRAVRIDDTTYKKLVAIADKEMRTTPWQIGYILEKFVENYERENGPIDISDVTDSTEDD